MSFKGFFFAGLQKRRRIKILHPSTQVILCGILFSVGCGIKIGEKPWFSGDRIYDWTLPSASRCDALEYRKTFEDFFTKEPQGENGFLHNMETAVLCFKKKLTEYKELIRGAHEDYLTRSELNNLLNHKVIRTGIEDIIDKITTQQGFHLFINIKNMVLKIFELSREGGFSSYSPALSVPPNKLSREGEDSPQKESSAKIKEASLSETICSPAMKKEVLYKKEVDEFGELLEIIGRRLKDLHTTARELAGSLNGYIQSEQLLSFLESIDPDRDLEENIKHLLQRNLHHLSEGLLIKYLVEENRHLWPEEEELKTTIRTFLKDGGNPQLAESFLQRWFLAKRSLPAQGLPPENHPLGSHPAGNHPLGNHPIGTGVDPHRISDSPGDGDSSLKTIAGGEEDSDTKTHSVENPPESFYKRLREHPKEAFSVPEIRRNALLFVLSNNENIHILFPGFSKYLFNKGKVVSSEKKKKDKARFFEKDWWTFGKTPAEKELDEVLDNIYAMTEISGKLLPYTSRITLTDAKYLLLNIQLSEMIMNIYDFNENGFVERKELKSVYCLFESFGPVPGASSSPLNKSEGLLQTWWKKWKKSASDPKNVFNYILKYQEIPSEDLNSHFILAVSNESLADEEVFLSRSAVVKLMTVLFLRFFPEKYFLATSPSNTGKH